MSFWSLKNTLTVEQRRIFVETAKEREGKAPLSDKKYTTRDFGNIYRMIYQKKQSSRQQIAEQLGISLPTVTQNLKLLNESGLICKGGVFQSTGGRKANSFQFVPDARYALGIDITQNHLSIVLINLNLDLMDSRRMRRAFEDTGSYYQSLAAEVEAFLKERDLDMEKLLGVGISLPAIIEEDQKTISYATVIQISGSIYEHIRTYLPYPFLLFNDASSAGLAESWLLKSSNLIVYLLLSNSVGGSLTIEGKIFKGVNARASEFGHMCIVPHGKRCYCGCYGCLDAYCSAKNLSDFTDGNLEAFFDKLSSGNLGYRRIFDEYMDELAVAVNNLRMCYDCDVILGGTVGSHMAEYIKQFRRKAAALNPFETSGDYIKSCHYRTEASAVGAAAHYIHQFIESL